MTFVTNDVFRPIPILAISGPKEGGKTTLAEMVKTNLSVQGFSADIFNMADPLHEMAYRTNPIIGISATGLPIYYAEATDGLGYDKAKSTYPGYREFLQRLGTEGIHPVDQLFWVREIMRRVDASPADVAIVTSYRFPHEHAYTQPDILVYVDNTANYIKRRNSPDNHSSETKMAELRDKAAWDILARDLTELQLISYGITNELIDRMRGT